MKKTLSIILALVMVFGVSTGALADGLQDKLQSTKVESIGDKIVAIQNMQIIQGDENGNLNLQNSLTRAEGSAVYSRLFGFRLEASRFSKDNPEFKTPFTDIPKWANTDINYLFNSNIVSGISATEFGSNNPMTAEQFTTMILRGLGYNDKAGEFSWDKSLDKAIEIGLIDAYEKNQIETDKTFTREEMIIISYNALFVKNKDNKMLLQARQKGNTNSILANTFIELTEEEITEIQTIDFSTPKNAFENNKSKQDLLFKKLKQFSEQTMDKFTISIDGKPVKIKVNEVYKVLSDGWDGEYVIFNDGLFVSYSLVGNNLVPTSDEDNLKELIALVISEKHANQENTMIKLQVTV